MNSSILSFKKNKLKNIFIYFIILIILIFLLDKLLFFSFLNFEIIYYNKNNTFQNDFKKEFSKIKYDTLLFGSSRTYEGIHPIYLNKHLGISVFKDAYQGRGPRSSYYFYKLYKKHFGKPKIVIYGIDYFIYSITSNTQSMSRFGKSSINRDKIGFFSEPLLLLKHKQKIDIFINNFILNIFKNKTVDPIKHLKIIQSYTGAPHQPDKLIADKPLGKLKRQIFPTPPRKEGEYLIKLLDELQKDNVPMFFVTIPDHFGTYKTNFQRNKFNITHKELIKKYKNLYILNFYRRKQFPIKNAEYFLNGGWGKTNCHLSEKGAKIFNKLLSLKIKNHLVYD